MRAARYILRFSSCIAVPSLAWRSNCDAFVNATDEPFFPAEPLQKARKVSLEHAQQLSVHCLKKKFSKNEIEEIFQFEAQNLSSLGFARRDGQGVRRMDGPWSTTYLHTDGLFQKKKDVLLRKIIAAALEADAAENWGLLGRNANDFRVRVVECHTVGKGGSLQDKYHCDRGSLVTIDIMCSDSADYSGGRFMTLEPNGVLMPHEFEFGDVMVFPSHKYHCVEPVQKGTRRVVVVELWEGVEKKCAHRCEDPTEECRYTKAHNNMDLMIKCPFPEVDPW